MFLAVMQINIRNTVRCEMFVGGMQIDIMKPVRGNVPRPFHGDFNEKYHYCPVKF